MARHTQPSQGCWPFALALWGLAGLLAAAALGVLRWPPEVAHSVPVPSVAVALFVGGLALAMLVAGLAVWRGARGAPAWGVSVLTLWLGSSALRETLYAQADVARARLSLWWAATFALGLVALGLAWYAAKQAQHESDNAQ